MPSENSDTFYPYEGNLSVIFDAILEKNNRLFLKEDIDFLYYIFLEGFNTGIEASALRISSNINNYDKVLRNLKIKL